VFRPCIDLLGGRVVQIVGATLTDDPTGAASEIVNFASERPSSFFASQYRKDRLLGGHVVMLGPGNDEPARDALASWPGGMQIGGGITVTNAQEWLDAGASHVIVTSWLFVDGALSMQRVAELVDEIGRDRIVIDLSCRFRGGDYWVMTDRWQRFTSLRVDRDVLGLLADSCAEFLVHGVDVEGLSQGVDPDLVSLLAEHSPVPATYAGGARSLDDLRTVDEISGGRVDLTIGTALDIFGGTGVAYADCVAFNRARR
jgi:phosphoribosylformimino-5-aminoimidazole carboxamide ribotide isomerase